MDALGFSDFSFLPSIVTRAQVPEDLASVQTVDAKAEVAAREVGLDTGAVEDIWAAVLRLYRTGIHPALSVCVRVRGQVILRRSVGYSRGGGPEDSDLTPKVKVTPETPFNVFSASKPMAAMVIHLLDQRHLLHLDDPVCVYIPEFAAHGKEWVTIRHVLTHRAGIPVIPEDSLDLSFLEDINNKEAIRLLCETKPTYRAGGRLAYHAVTGGFILGEIARRVTGKNIRKIVDEEFCRPLGWRWMNFGVKARDVEKVASSYFTGLPLVPPMDSIVQSMLGIDFEEAVRLSNDPRYLMGVLPAANLVATADELCQFYQLLLEGGKLRGKRIFEPRTVWRATSEQSYGELDFTLGVPLRYGMGFMLGGEYLSLYGYDSRHAFGHLGLTNIVAWADPQRHLSVAIMNSGKPVLYPEMHRGLSLIYTIASVCKKDETMPARPGEETRPRNAGAKAKSPKRKTDAPKATASKATRAPKTPAAKATAQPSKSKAKSKVKTKAREAKPAGTNPSVKKAAAKKPAAGQKTKAKLSKKKTPSAKSR